MPIKLILMFLLSAFIFGCSAVGVVATNNPHKKIDQAVSLINSNRPIPADTLIAQAIEIFENKNDHAGLFRAYEAKTTLLLSKAVENNESFFRKSGFTGDGKIYGQRHEKAIEYFLKITDIIKNNSRNPYPALTLIHIKITEIYSNYLNNKVGTCNNLKIAKTNHDLNHKTKSEKRSTVLAAGYETFDVFYNSFNTKHKCT